MTKSEHSATVDVLEPGLSPFKSRALHEKIGEIRKSLDLVQHSLLSQQISVTREFEDRIRDIYDSVLNDINTVRQHVNTIGEHVAAQDKYKTCSPTTSFCKYVPKTAFELQNTTTKLKSSKSVDFIDSRPTDTDKTSKSSHNLGSRYRWMSFSSTSVGQKSRSRTQLAGYGCCFHGETKTTPHCSHRDIHSRNVRHSWGPSRCGSRSDLDDDGSRPGVWAEVAADWRAHVALNMWHGWPRPGIHGDHVQRLRDTLEPRSYLTCPLELETFRRETLAAHNHYRQQHGCPELHLSDDLSRDAQQWAELLAIKGYAQYSETADRGENVLVFDSGHEVRGQHVVDTWYRECTRYNYTRPGWQRGTSNFTQLVWRGSRCLGVGLASFPQRDAYVIVTQYLPTGNVNTAAQFSDNVPPPPRQADTQPEVT